MLEGRSSLSAWERMVAGAVAGVCSVTATYPLDLLRTRLSLLDGQGVTLMGSARRIWAEEGGMRGFYCGLGATLAGIAPYVALNFTSYETLKGLAQAQQQGVAQGDAEQPLGVGERLACGGAAGAIAQTCTYPFDVVRHRMQVAGSGAVRYRYRTAREAFRRIVTEEGVGALFRGMLANYLKVVPAISISFVTFELVRSVL